MQGDWHLMTPLQWMCYVNKEVKVTAGKDDERCGWLLTVDPVSASLVLIDFRADGHTSVDVVMGHAVKEVQVIREPDEETLNRLQNSFVPVRTCSLDSGELKRRRTLLKEWLQKNLIPVEEEGEELKVAGVLLIRAPYKPDDCCSSNQIILDRIQKLIQNLDSQNSMVQSGTE